MHRPWGGPMLLGLALLWDPTVVRVLNFEQQDFHELRLLFVD